MHIVPLKSLYAQRERKREGREGVNWRSAIGMWNTHRPRVVMVSLVTLGTSRYWRNFARALPPPPPPPWHVRNTRAASKLLPSPLAISCVYRCNTIVAWIAQAYNAADSFQLAFALVRAEFFIDPMVYHSCSGGASFSSVLYTVVQLSQFILNSNLLIAMPQFILCTFTRCIYSEFFKWLFRVI